MRRKRLPLAQRSRQFSIILPLLFVTLLSGCSMMQSTSDLSLGASGKACPPLGPAGAQKVDEVCPPLPKEFLPKIMAISKPQIGTRYKYGGTTPGGFDCSGFTAYVYKHFNIKLPRGSYNQLPLGRPVAKGELRPGDLLFFKISRRAVVTHVGIYIGNDQMVHASIQKGVTIDRVFGDSYYNKHYYGARRLPQVEALALTASATN